MNSAPQSDVSWREGLLFSLQLFGAIISLLIVGSIGEALLFEKMPLLFQKMSCIGVAITTPHVASAGTITHRFFPPIDSNKANPWLQEEAAATVIAKEVFAGRRDYVCRLTFRCADARSTRLVVCYRHDDPLFPADPVGALVLGDRVKLKIPLTPKEPLTLARVND